MQALKTHSRCKETFLTNDFLTLDQAQVITKLIHFTLFICSFLLTLKL